MGLVYDKPEADKRPDEKPLEGRSLKSDLAKYGPAFLRGGVLGVAGEGMSQAMDTVGRLTNAAAYRGGGYVTDKAAQLGLPAEVSAGLGFATNVGTQAIPVVLGGLLSKSAGQPAIEHGARSLMRSALKPDKASNLKMMSGTKVSEADAAINTMLDKGINVSRGGLTKIEGQVDDLNAQIKAAISGSNASIDKSAVLQRIDDLKKIFQAQAAPQADLAAIGKTANQFSTHPSFLMPPPAGRMTAQQYQQFLQGGGYRNDIPVQLAQELKSGTYRALGNKSFGELKGAEVEAQKAIARGLKEEIAKAVPDVKALNKAESDLLNAARVLENRLAVEGNKNPMGLGWLAERPASALGFLFDRSALAKGLLARAIHNSSGAVPFGVGASAGGLLGPTYLNDPYYAP